MTSAGSGSPGHVVGLGAICDLTASADGGRTKSFAVSEFAELADGTRVVLHAERGFTTGWVNVAEPDEIASLETLDSLERNVLNVVLPDEDDGEPHPWDWLARLARRQGLEVTADDLRSVPYRVVFSDAVTELFGPAD